MMLALAVNALGARRAQAAALLLLTALAAGSAAAAPWYVLTAAERVAVSYVAAAPPQERILHVRQRTTRTGSVVDGARGTAADVERALHMPGFEPVTGAAINGRAAATGNGRQTTSALVYRQAVCEHASVQGACPTAPGEVMLSARTAASLHLAVGGTFRYESSDLAGPAQLTVVGVYRPTDPDDPFWSSAELVARVEGSQTDAAVDDAVFISAAGMDALQPAKVVYAVDLIVTGAVFVATPPAELPGRLADVEYHLTGRGHQFDADMKPLAERVERDQQLIYVGVAAGAAQLLILCWFALFLAVKYTGVERRPDIGLLKLRGTRTYRTSLLVLGQSVLPMGLGAAVGVAVGLGVARLTGGRIDTPGAARLAVLVAIGGAALAVLGALFAALAGERRGLAAPVVDLVRQVPARRRAWWGLADVVVVVLALAALYQVNTRATGAAAGLALLAPGLVALAVGLLVARAVTAVAGRAAGEALRNGWPASALTAVHLARRPGVDRLCALLVVTIAMLGTAVLAWDAGSRASQLRAEQELGADRVLTVRAVNRAHLLEAVRLADPAGRSAMAAVEFTGPGRQALLVDSPRLAAVARWRPEYGAPSAKAAAALLHPPAPEPIRVTGRGLAVDVTARQAVGSAFPDRPARPAYLLAVLAGPRGVRVEAVLGPLVEGRQRVRADAAACAEASHCRLVSLSFVRPGFVGPGGGSAPGRDAAAYERVEYGASVTLHRLDQTGPDSTVVDTATFTDRSRWRPTTGTEPSNLVVTTDDSGLKLAAPPPRSEVTIGAVDSGLYPMDSPAPAAVIRAGSASGALAGDPRVQLGGTAVPVHVAARAGVLPRVGAAGALLDLEYADRLSGDFGAGESMQVWLRDDAPDAVVDRLRAGGLEVVDDTSLAEATDRLTALGPPVALRFQLVAAVIGLLLAAGAVAVVAAVERRPRTAELAALRTQGASAKLARRVASGGYLVLLLVALLAGAATAVVARAFAAARIPFFADGWSLLDIGSLPRPWPLGLAALAVFAALGGVALLAPRRVVASLGDKSAVSSGSST